jgi:CheY-like chemotaxis protein
MTSFDPEVVLLDIGMPGLSGYDLAHRIRARNPDRPILLIAQTGWGHQRDRQLSAAAGIDHHLVKPIDFVQLHQILSTRFGSGVDQAVPNGSA